MAASVGVDRNPEVVSAIPFQVIILENPGLHIVQKFAMGWQVMKFPNLILRCQLEIVPRCSYNHVSAFLQRPPSVVDLKQT